MIDFLAIVGLFILGAAAGAVVNLVVDLLRYDVSRRYSPWIAADSGGAGEASKRRNRGQDRTAPVAPRAWPDRVPIAGWFYRKREEPRYGVGFWLRPMMVELLLATAFAFLYWWEVIELQLIPFAGRAVVDAAAVHWQYFSHVVLLCLLAAAALIDLDEWVIPDWITLPGTLIGLSLAMLAPQSLLPVTMVDGRQTDVSFLHAASPHEWPPLLEAGAASSLAIVLGCLGLWCFAQLPRRWLGRHGRTVAMRLIVRRVRREVVHMQLSFWVLVTGLLATAAVVPVWWVGGPCWIGLASSFIGLAAGGGIIWTVRLIGAATLKREAMGFGDVTLMAMIGAFFGWQPCLFVFFLSPFFGLLPPLMGLLTRSELQAEIPYGPFLCAGAVTVLLLWAAIWNWAATGIFGPLAWLLPPLLGGCAVAMIMLLAIIQLVKGLLGRTGNHVS